MFVVVLRLFIIYLIVFKYAYSQTLTKMWGAEPEKVKSLFKGHDLTLMYRYISMDKLC